MFPGRLPLVIAFAFAWISGFAATPTPSPVAPPPWPHEQSDLVPDPRVTWGRLENGLGFAILPHAQPAGRVSLCLLVQAGSYYETEDERGYAHFVEHMAFNGTRDFPGTSVVATLERLGLAFGPHINAGTSFFETHYILTDLAAARREDVATGLKVLRNFADGVVFDEREVKKERGVILSEGRARSGAMRHVARSEFEFVGRSEDEIRTDELDGLFDETRIENRYPFGTERGINRASSKALRAFYDRWYRPERMILAVVGDLEPAAIETLVRETFASFAGRGVAGVPPPIVAPPLPAAPLPAIFGRWHRVEPSLQVSLGNAVPFAGPENSARRRLTLARRLALGLVMDRINEFAHVAAASSLGFLSHSVPGWDLPILRLDTKPEEKTAAVLALDTELRRACEHGFDADEFQSTMAGMPTRFRDGINATQSWPSSSMAVEMAFAAARGIVWTSAEEDVRLADEMLATLTADECRDALRALWPPERTKILLSGPTQPTREEDAKLRATLLAARALPLVARNASTASRPFPYTNFGPAGAVVWRRHDDALDVWFIDFANGVRLNFKPTNLEPGRVNIAVNFGHGILGAPADRQGLACAIYAMAIGGLRDVTKEESEAVRAASGFAAGASMTSDRFILNAEGPTRGVSGILGFFAAQFVAAAFDTGRQNDFTAIVRQALAGSERTAAGVAADERCRLLFGGHPAVRVPTINDVTRHTFEEFRAWLEPQIATSPLDVVIVGDLSVEAAIEKVAVTFGALAARQTEESVLALRAHKPASVARRETVKFDGSRAVAVFGLGWTTPDEPGRADNLRVQLLGGVLRNRLESRVREEMGETYAPKTFAGDVGFLAPPLMVLACEIDAAPRRVNRVAKAVRKVVEDLVRGGVTPDELERVRKPAARMSEDFMKRNAWWVAQLADARARPDSVEGLADLPRAYEAVTAEELTAMLRAAFTIDRAREWTVVPR